MKYRKKPAVIDAVQFTASVRDAYLFDGRLLPPGVQCGSSSVHPVERRVYGAYFYIKNLDLYMAVNLGEWVITDVNGQVFLCDPDVFELNYEPVDELPLTITAELPRPEIKKDTKVRVRDKHTDELVNRYATGDFYKSRILCYPNGADSFTTDKAQGVIDWDYYEIVEDE